MSAQKPASHSVSTAERWHPRRPRRRAGFLKNTCLRWLQLALCVTTLSACCILAKEIIDAGERVVQNHARCRQALSLLPLLLRVPAIP